jgi:small subunit ribosomal protein S27Ae
MADAKKEKQKGTAGLKRKFYKIDGTRLSRERPNCPKCGPGVFLAKHADRVSCGRCGYTEFAKK